MLLFMSAFVVLAMGALVTRTFWCTIAPRSLRLAGFCAETSALQIATRKGVCQSRAGCWGFRENQTPHAKSRGVANANVLGWLCDKFIHAGGPAG